MKTVFLVGAGATLAEALPRQPARSRRPPLDTTFFELCRLAKLEGRTIINNYMFRHYGIRPLTGQYRMEEIFNFLYAEAFSDNPSQQCLDAYWALIRMYTLAIARTTNRLTGTSRAGIGQLLRWAWNKNPGSEISFITFNQDLVIEKAIDSIAHTGTYAAIPWDIEECYTLAFNGILGATGRRFRPTHSSLTTPSIRILKLHGSLNWVYKVRSGQDPKNAIRSPRKDIYCLRQQTVLSGLQMMVNQRSVDLIPLFVPPIYEKNSRYQAAVGPLWETAVDELGTADQLIVFGYSFPDTDFAARSMIRRAFHRNGNTNQVTVIDPSPLVAARITDLLGTDCTMHFRGVRAFCEGSSV